MWNGKTSIILLICTVVQIDVAHSFRLSSYLPNTQHGRSIAHPSTFRRSLSNRNMVRSDIVPQSTRKPWYSDADLKRDRLSITKTLSDAIEPGLDVKADDSSLPICIKDGKFVLSVEKQGMVNVSNGEKESHNGVNPLYFAYGELIQVLGANTVSSLLNNSSSDHILIWIGNHKGTDYWAVHIPERDKQLLIETIKRCTDGKIASNDILPLREFGDVISTSSDAAVCATANGLIEFHRSHKFCSLCGSPTESIRAGGARRCTDAECNSSSIYPRIDVASIMLVTSPCGEYALLGRKSFWPAGRYSTLSGFAEVGETLEECCIRETFEESGVVVDTESVRFVLSQPWPFPKSLMIGFQARASFFSSSDAGCDESKIVADPNFMGENPSLPSIIVEDEMESIKWFHRDYVRIRLSGGSTSLTFEPNAQEKEFHIPGKASLARNLITRWANKVES
mmetsp:Transcript_26934/g.62000  ORF Transcript_26934/g.62000 Transcript_26934/m.62000 type:complete len:452 (-) Transcript_26934:88-1443(-)